MVQSYGAVPSLALAAEIVVVVGEVVTIVL